MNYNYNMFLHKQNPPVQSGIHRVGQILDSTAECRPNALLSYNLTAR